MSRTPRRVAETTGNSLDNFAFEDERMRGVADILILLGESTRLIAMMVDAVSNALLRDVRR
jgi:hypothetical protein